MNQLVQGPCICYIDSWRWTLWIKGNNVHFKIWYRYCHTWLSRSLTRLHSHRHTALVSIGSRLAHVLQDLYFPVTGENSTYIALTSFTVSETSLFSYIPLQSYFFSTNHQFMSLNHISFECWIFFPQWLMDRISSQFRNYLFSMKWIIKFFLFVCFPFCLTGVFDF